MPAPIEILQSLRTIAREALPLAVAWHVAALAAMLGVFAGWRPTERTAGWALTAPLISVSALAFWHSNPFNGMVLGIAATALLVVSTRLGSERVTPGPQWTSVVGWVLLAFGWVYPHFLEEGSRLTYLYAAPLGLVPCPTLAAVTGASLLVNGLRSRAWRGVVGSLALFYGLFGAFRLGVILDLTLVFGAVALLGTLAHETRSGARLARSTVADRGGW